MVSLIQKLLSPLAIASFVIIAMSYTVPSTSQATEADGHALSEMSDQLVFSSSEQLLSQEEMDAARGAAAINTLSTTQALAAETSGNTLNVGGNLTNGSIAVGDNLGGIGSYVMNTGNNSTINSAISLNVQIMPSP